MALAWYDHNEKQWSPVHASDVRSSLERFVFPAIGALPPEAISPPLLLGVMAKIQQCGCFETARRIRQRLSAIFGYGIAVGAVDRDPAQHLGRAMHAPPPVKNHPALVSLEECRALLADCEAVTASASIKLASRFLALTAVRLAAVRGMRWNEVEETDDGWLWRIPASRMKLKRAKKGDRRFDHQIPLSGSAVAILRMAPGQGSSDQLVFHGRAKDRMFSEGAINSLYDRAGYAGRHVPHGWRSSFSTILNERLGEAWAMTIDRALAHSPKDKVEAAYNRAQQLSRRRELFDAWGGFLCEPPSS